MVTLTEEEERGLRIIAMIREGELTGFECETCQLHEQRNCAGAEDHSVPVLFKPELGQLFVCPIRLIPKNIITFLDEYDFYEKYPSAVPHYRDINPRFWAAVKFFDNARAKIINNKSDSKGKPKMNDQENRSKMKDLVRRGK
jgi:hypothetical protein